MGTRAPGERVGLRASRGYLSPRQAMKQGKTGRSPGASAIRRGRPQYLEQAHGFRHDGLARAALQEAVQARPDLVAAAVIRFGVGNIPDVIVRKLEHVG